MTDAQTPRVHKKNCSFFPPRERWSETTSFIVFSLFHHTLHTGCVLFNSCGGNSFAWLRPKIHFTQSKGNCTRTKTTGSVSYPSKLSIALHSNKRWRGRRERTICAVPAERASWGWETALDRPWHKALSPLVPPDKYQFNCRDMYCHCKWRTGQLFLG